MTGDIPVRREIPAGVAFGDPFGEFYEWTILLSRELDRAIADEIGYDEEMHARFGIPPTGEGTKFTEMYSVAIQVFAAITLEGAMNFYATLRFGEDAFEDFFRWKPPEIRIRHMLASENGELLPGGSEILAIVRRVFGARNELVHPRGGEYTDSDENKFLQKGRQSQARSDIEAAKTAITDLRKFFQLIEIADPGVMPLMMP